MLFSSVSDSEITSTKQYQKTSNYECDNSDPDFMCDSPPDENNTSGCAQHGTLFSWIIFFNFFLLTILIN